MTGRKRGRPPLRGRPPRGRPPRGRGRGRQPRRGQELSDQGVQSSRFHPYSQNTADPNHNVDSTVSQPQDPGEGTSSGNWSAGALRYAR